MDGGVLVLGLRDGQQVDDRVRVIGCEEATRDGQGANGGTARCCSEDVSRGMRIRGGS